ncbi:class I SAM-dependent methyltransferase [Candidatus Dependentiae bacterium]
MQQCEIKHKDALIRVEQLGATKRRVSVEPKNKNFFVAYKSCETSYDLELIKEILSVKGPGYLCDEIMRDESSEYLQKSLHYSLLSYVDKTAFANKRILDFGCGSGSSTMILRRMFPGACLVGIDLEQNLLHLAKLRAAHHGFDDLTFLLSPDENSLPSDIGTFDYILLSAVFEHLLPEERNRLLPKMWQLLKPGGVLFINRTPYRYFPIEVHTTGGLPLLNYLPNGVARWYARRFSKRNLHNDSWPVLLRKGIRGGSCKEILGILRKTEQQPLLLKPSQLGVKDRVDLWYRETNLTKQSASKKGIFWLAKSLKLLTGLSVVPNLSLAIKKTEKI